MKDKKIVDNKIVAEPIKKVVEFTDEYYKFYRQAIALNMTPEEAAKYANEKC